MYSCKKVFIILFISVFVSGFLLLSALPVHAMTPALSLTNNGDGDTVQLIVNGDPNASVMFWYTKVAIGLTPIANSWLTNSSGYFSVNISTSSYQITAGSSVYVTTSGLNGPRSNSVLWPISTSSTSSGTISLSQTGVVLAQGQSATVTASGVSSLYLSNNSNPPIANINVSQNTITILANAFGSTVATVCSSSSTSICAEIYITVQNSGTAALTFGQNNITIVSGQNVPISISGGNGAYMVQNNPNSAAVQTSINGSTITLSTTNTSGASSITVCSTDMSSCGIINVTIGTANSSVISFSPSNPTVSIGQGTSVTISGASGGVYYISSNSNSSIAQVSISSNILTIIGNTNGSSIVSICSSLGSCGSLTITVNYVASGGGISLSQTSLTLLTGQTLSIVISGGTAPYNVINPSTNVAQTSLNGNILTIYGASVGSESLNVCSSEGGCVSLSVLVNGSGASAQTTATTTTLPQGCASTAGYSSITGQSCATVATTPATTAPTYVFPRYLGYGDTGDDVLQLQKLLTGLGFLSITPNSRYGPATTAAVKEFQQAHGIRQTGNVGPSTLTALNQISSSTSTISATNSTKDQQISAIQLEIQQLLAQIAQIQGQ